jgi:E3 ubiquitin-protein ligase BAH
VRISEADDASSSSQGEHSKTPQNQDGTEDISQQETTLSSTTGFDSVPERPDQTGPIDTSKGHTIIRQRVEISLTSDSEFFQLLQTEMTNLEGLQDLEKDAMEDQINSISRSVAKVATPRSKSDLYRWREIFDLYSQAKIFFSTNEADRGSRNADAAAKQLQWFSNQLIKDGRQPKTKDGKIALEQFMWLNRVLLRNLQFQEINGLAMTKILKSMCDQSSLHLHLLTISQNLTSVPHSVSSKRSQQWSSRDHTSLKPWQRQSLSRFPRSCSRLFLN